MIYADTSALAKLFTDESESAALRAWLGQRTDDPVVTSVVGEIEMRRFALRLGVDASARVSSFLTTLDRLVLTSETVAVAGRIGPPTLRSLDALHLAAAILLPDLSALLTYDRRMVDAARACGLPVVSPS